ncbi:hypothetical protein [Mycobacterium sp. AZCC_0083]|uniref:hypothetical protein n=1 Tax=Mycobacterium sp. AZCC_0083 TaxID=2735882 RepID=UPI0017C435F3|nr:hypothetical protein [Mycobacterium sp. AZCC_0083]MBB5166310.1 hypothetical protein [Mycobacterium sp. AZCC_0083]
MADRKTLLVGSIPGDDTEQAVELAMGELGSTLLAVPDGETGSRSQWVVSIVEGLRTNPAVVLKKDGAWSSYDDRPKYKVRRGLGIDPASLELGYSDAYRESRMVVEAVTRKHGVTDVAHQVGVASGFDLALFALGLPGALRHRGTFNTAVAREIDTISTASDGDVLFQIEAPAELVMVAQAPRVLRRIMAAWAARIFVELPRMSQPTTQFGVHLCFGDLGNQAMVRGLRDCSAAVALANAVVARWPSGVSLQYLHLPLAAGDEPPTLDPAYYAPLARLRVPTTTRVVAGFVHEGLSDGQLRLVLRLVESAAGRRVDIAAPCGLGRRERDVARRIMQSSRTLCTAR